MEVILSQALSLLFASQWSLTTERHPLPLVSGLVSITAEVNEVSSVSLDSKNSGKEGKESEDLKISEGYLSDAYQNVLKRLAQLQNLGDKGANKMKQWRGGLELEPWMDSLDDGWTKNMVLEEFVDIDIGYDAPPPSFSAGMELKKRRRAPIEAAKCRIDAISKAPVAASMNANDSQVLRNEDVCPPQKLASKL